MGQAICLARGVLSCVIVVGEVARVKGEHDDIAEAYCIAAGQEGDEKNENKHLPP